MKLMQYHPVSFAFRDTWLMDNNPIVYGLNKTSEALDELGVYDAFDKFYNKFWDLENDVMIHPLYVNLQFKSKLNILAANPFDIRDHEYDQESNPVDGKTFYRKYMSKSLPCVFRKEATKDKFYLELSKATTKAEIDEVLVERFKAIIGMGKVVRTPKFDLAIMATKISKHRTKQNDFAGQSSTQIPLKYAEFVKEKEKLASAGTDEILFIERHKVDNVYVGFTG